MAQLKEILTREKQRTTTELQRTIYLYLVKSKEQLKKDPKSLPVFAMWNVKKVG